MSEPATRLVQILKKMKSFRPTGAFDASVLPSEISKDQTVLGVYENVRGSLVNAVIVTNESLWLERAGEFAEVRFENMGQRDWTPEHKREAKALKITMRDGTIRLVPILGRDDHGADVFEFLRFVGRVIGELKAGHVR